ncbi:MAG: hypothetical protein PVSMB4_08560 [Ktedonobacterales bacterium]
MRHTVEGTARLPAGMSTGWRAAGAVMPGYRVHERGSDATMQTWEYKVAYIDYRGRISVEGQETLIENERRTTFVRRYLDTLGRAGWELSSVQPLSPQSAYYVFKRPSASGDSSSSASHSATQTEAGASAATGAPLTI